MEEGIGMPDTRLESEEVSISNTRRMEEELSMSETKMELSHTIKSMARFLYEREHVKKEHPIYKFDEMCKSLEEHEHRLKNFLTNFI